MMRKVFLFAHRWLGLAAALVIAFLSISGAALVFGPEIDAKLNPQLLRVEPQAKTASFQSITDETQRQFPNRKISFLFTAKRPDAAHEFWLDKGELRVYANPYSGEIMGARTQNESFFTWLFRAHTHLFAGEIGEQIAGWSGLILASLSVSGLVLWWPRAKSGWKRAFQPNLKTNWKGRVYELHRAGGFWICLLLFNSGLSGAALVWPDAATRFASVFGISAPQKIKASGGEARDLDELVAIANRAFPDGKVTRITFPTTIDAPLTIRKKLSGETHPNGMNNISLDAATGRVLKIADSRRAQGGERLMNLRYPLHIGAWGASFGMGNFSRVLAVLGGIGGALLALSGVAMWLNGWKRARRRTGESHKK